MGNNMQHLEGFQHATTLDLKIGYYIITFLPASQDMTAIVTEFGKLRYNFLPMGMCALGDIFQPNIYGVLGDIEGVKMYIDDIIILSKD